MIASERLNCHRSIKTLVLGDGKNFNLNAEFWS